MTRARWPGKWFGWGLVGFLAVAGCGVEGSRAQVAPPALDPGDADPLPGPPAPPDDPPAPPAPGEVPVHAEPPPSPEPEATWPTQPGFGDPPGPGAYPSVEAEVPALDLAIAAADLAQLEADPRSDAMVPAVVTVSGRSVPAAVRYRGASARTFPQKSFRVDLDPGHEVDGRDSFALIAEYPDGGKLTERFILDLFRALGLHAPRARYVRLTVNGELYGVHLDVERVTKEFLELHGLHEGASIYRCGGRNCEMKIEPRAGSYQSDFEKTRNESAPWDDLDELLRIVNRTDDDELVRELEARVDLQGYLENLAVDALVSNFLVEDSRSYWIHEGVPDRWRYVPWDLNNAMSLYRRGWSLDRVPRTDRDPRVFTVYDPSVDEIYRTRIAERAGQKPTWSVLATRLWDIPATRARILDALEAALDGPFADAAASAHVEALWAAAGDAILSDPYVLADQAARAPAFLARYVRDRAAFLRARLDRLRAHGDGPLVVNEVGFAHDGEPGYVELYNRGTEPIDLGGLAITDDLRVPERHALPAGLRVPGRGHLVLVADGGDGPDRLSFAPSPLGGAVGIFRVGTVHDPLDAVYWGPHAPARAYGRAPDGDERFREASPTPGAPAAP
jgi:spore coat protein H